MSFIKYHVRSVSNALINSKTIERFVNFVYVEPYVVPATNRSLFSGRVYNKLAHKLPTARSIFIYKRNINNVPFQTFIAFIRIHKLD